MPTYIYKALDKGCEYSKGRFGAKQNIVDKPVEMSKRQGIY